MLLVLSILAITAYQLLSARAAILASARLQVTQLDAILGEQTARAFDMVDAALRHAAAARHDGSPPATVAAALRREVAMLHQVAEAGLADPQGLQPGVNAQPPTAAPPGVRALLSAAPGAMAIGAPERGSDGQWRAWVVRPLVGPHGEPDGLAYAAINLAFFDSMFRAAEISSDGAVLLLRNDGVTLMVTPLPSGGIGRRYGNLDVLRNALATDGVSIATVIRPLDHDRRLVAIRPLRDVHAIVTVSLSRRVVLAPWRRSALVFTTVACAACAAITLLMLALAGRSRELDHMYQDVRGAKEAADAANRELRRQMAEREQAEAALREAQRAEAIGQLTRGVAHDFNNLLAVVLGNIDLMTVSHRDDAPAQKRLATMRAAAERGAMLTSQLMAFARRQPLQPRAVDLNEVVSHMQPLLASAVGSRIRVALDLAPDLPPAQVDPTQIELAILNLAINARDAMIAGGVLTITTGPASLAADDARSPAVPRPDAVALSVRDNGLGMPPEVRAKAFEPFFTTKGPGRGSGLGLSQVHGLAYQSGGRVQLHSAPGDGTQVEIILPAACGPADPAAAPATAIADARRNERVLLVDDDAAVRETAAAVLHAEGYTVTEAAEAGEALRLLRGGATFDVLVTDVVMPGMSGPELIRELHRLLPELPMVLISGYSEPAELAASGMPGFFVRKPFTPNALTSTIQAAINHRSAAA